MTLQEYNYDKEPIVSIVKKILTEAIKQKVSDIHFDPKQKGLSIRFRINGDLFEFSKAPDTAKSNILTRIKIIAGMNVTNNLSSQIGSIKFKLNSNTYNMRVASLPTINGEKITIHLSNYANNIKSINKIGINDEEIEKIKHFIKEEQGFILVTGTSSSGKTTTLYTLLKELNSKSKNIISIEEPIKMKIEDINQVEISPEKGITYQTALKNSLLLDPNIISIDKITDDEIARNALRASVTGKLVLSTMYTKSAYQTIDNLLNMDIENYLLGNNLLGIISQRLVKKLCPSCKEKKEISTYEKNIIKELTDIEVDEIYYPKGCEDCQKGYISQIPITEVVAIDDELRNAIANNKDRNLIRKIIYSDTNSILKNGFLKVIEGETSFEEIIRITDIKIDFDEEQNNLKQYILGNTQEIKNSNSINDENIQNQINNNEQTENKTKEEIQNTETNTSPIKEDSQIENTNTNDEQINKIETNKKLDTNSLYETPIKNESTEDNNLTTNESETKVEVEKEITNTTETENNNVENEDNNPINNEVDTKKSNIEIKINFDDNIEENIDTQNNSENNNNEINKEQPITFNQNIKNESSTIITSFNNDDNEDDENDFNYDNSYINNF